VRALDRLLRRIDWTGEGFVRQVLVGHPGCGKTTELHCLAEVLEDADVFTVAVHADRLLSLEDVAYADVLVAAADRVLDASLERLGLSLERRDLEELRQGLHVETRGTTKGLKAEAGLKASLGILQGELRISSERRRELRSKVEADQAGFLAALNRLLLRARQRLAESGKRGMVLILDGLEKMRFRRLEGGGDSHEDFFVRRAELLAQVRCHLVLTAPISLTYEHKLGDLYTSCQSLPMVAVRGQSGGERLEGLASLRRLVEARVAVGEVFERPADLDDLARLSGGHVRDLLRLVRYSCEAAGDRPRLRTEDVSAALAQLIREYDQLIAGEDIEPLLELGRSRMLRADAAHVKLLRKLLALEYVNDDRWGDVHPAAAQGLIMRTARAAQPGDD